MVLDLKGIPNLLFDVSRNTGVGTGSDISQSIVDEETFRGQLASGTSTDVDIFTTATKIKESTKNMEPGTYLIVGGLRTDIIDVSLSTTEYWSCTGSNFFNSDGSDALWDIAGGGWTQGSNGIYAVADVSGLPNGAVITGVEVFGDATDLAALSISW